MSLIQEALEKVGRIPSISKISAKPRVKSLLAQPELLMKAFDPEIPAVENKIGRPIKIFASGVLLFLSGLILFQAAGSRISDFYKMPRVSSSAAPSQLRIAGSYGLFAWSKPGEYRFTGIADEDGGRVALINDQVVAVGGRVGDARVIEIGERSVRLKTTLREFTLKL